MALVCATVKANRPPEDYIVFRLFFAYSGGQKIT
jgi:hypothetical protein